MSASLSGSIVASGAFTAATTAAAPQQLSLSFLPSPMETSPGQANVWISNGQPSEVFTITLDGTTLATVTGDAEGKWSGAISIPSTTANPNLRVNLASRPKCDAWGTGTDGIAAYNSRSGGTYTLPTGSTPNASISTYARKTSTTAQGSAAAGSVIAITPDNPDLATNTPPSVTVQPDTTYTLSMYCRYTPAASGGSLTNLRLTYHFYDQTGASSAAEASINSTASGTGWVQASWTVTTPHAGSLFAAYVYPLSPQYNPGDTFDITMLDFEAATGIAGYLDGDIGAGPGQSTYWTGTPSDSSSVLCNTHTLQAVGTSSPAVSGLLQIKNPALSVTINSGPSTPPATTSKWTFTDTRAGANPGSYTFTHNPSQWTPPIQVPVLSTDNTTAVGGPILTWEGGVEPAQFDFSGHLESLADYNSLDYWVNLKRRFWLTDHRGVQRQIVLTEFDATPHLGNGQWSHDYVVRGIQFQAIGAMA